MDEFKQIDEAIAIYKGPGAKNRAVLHALLADLCEWAEERGYNLQDELATVVEKRSA